MRLMQLHLNLKKLDMYIWENTGLLVEDIYIRVQMSIHIIFIYFQRMILKI